MTSIKPSKPTPDFPLYAHGNGQWAAKLDGKREYFGPWSEPLAAWERYNAKISAKRGGAKRSKFPLFLHKGSGQWAKKIKGKTHYFGQDKAAALDKYNAEKDSLERGEVRTAALTIRALVGQFLFHQEQRVVSGELGERTWYDYAALCAWIANVLGKETEVASLQPFDFGRLRAAFATGQSRPDADKIPKPTLFAGKPVKDQRKRNPRAKGKAYSPVTVHGLITHARVMFNFAEENLLDTRIKYGSQFDKPSQSTLRKARAERGELMFEREQVKALLAAAKPQLRAMIWLGINCAMGNADCAALEIDNLDLDGGWLNFPRVKTGIDRRCPLWPETVDAIKAALAARPAHKDDSDARRVFITKYGAAWTPKTLTGDCPITKETAKLLRKLKLARRGLGFYSLRRTFVTIAGEQVDREAIRTIGGWVKGANDMLARYEQRRPSDERLRAVAEHVRGWLMTDSPARQTAAGDGAATSAA